MYKPNALPWQTRSWDFYDANGPLHRGYTIKANTIARVRLFCAWQANPDDEPVPLDEALASDLIDTVGLTQTVIDQANDALWRVQAKDGGQAEILRLLALNLDVPGEGWLLGRDNGETEDWMVYSVEQIRWQGGGYVLYDTVSTGAKGTPIGPNDVLIRMWRKHPRVVMAADSAFRAQLDDLEQLHLLRSEVTAAASSRLAGSGVWLLDSRVDIPQRDDQRGAYNDAETALETLLEAAQTALRDPSSAAAAVPLIFQAEPPDGTKIADMQAHLTFDRPLHEATVRRYIDLRREIIEGADFPPEWVAGLGNTSTYANARIVTSEGYRQDVAPTAELIAAGLGPSWVRYVLETLGVPPQVRDKIVVWVDPDSVISKPDRAKYAVELGKLGISTGPVLSAEALRAAVGFDEGDAPTEDELADWRENQAIRGLPGAADEGNAAENDNPNADDDSGATQASVAAPLALAAGKPTQATLARASSVLVNIDVRLTDRLQTAGDRWVTDTLVKVGAQLRAKAQGSKDLKARVQGKPNQEVWAALGDKAIALASQDELLAGSLAVFEQQYQEWTAAAQKQALAAASRVRPGAYSDVDLATLERQQAEDRNQGWAWLAAALLTLMRGRMVDPSSSAPDMRGEWSEGVTVPYGYFRSAVSIAGGTRMADASRVGPVLTQSGTPAGGIGTGALISDSLRVQAGVTTGSYIWLHGDSAHPLDGHLALDSVEFADWDDPVLTNDESWPPYPRYFQSDHDGCSCAAERVLVVGD